MCFGVAFLIWQVLLFLLFLWNIKWAVHFFPLPHFCLLFPLYQLCFCSQGFLFYKESWKRTLRVIFKIPQVLAPTFKPIGFLHLLIRLAELLPVLDTALKMDYHDFQWTPLGSVRFFCCQMQHMLPCFPLLLAIQVLDVVAAK